MGGRAKRSATFPGIRNVGGGCKRFNAEAASAKAAENREREARAAAGKRQEAEEAASVGHPRPPCLDL